MHIDTLTTDPRVPGRMSAGAARAWSSIALPGTWFTGAERIEIASCARSSLASGGATRDWSIPEVVVDAARTVAVHAHQIDRARIDRFAADGLAAEPFVEVVGVVARTVAVDTMLRGIGTEPLAFPAPVPGEPLRSVQPSAKRRSAYVPMVGAAGATNALSAVPSEDAAQEDLHGALYLSYAEMGDFSIVKELPRWQLELVAARTSLINHCHF